MDFGSLSGKASMKRKQSNSLLAALGKQSNSRASNIPIASNIPFPSTATSLHFPKHPSSASEDHHYSAIDSPYYSTSSSSSYPDSAASTTTSGRPGGHVPGRSVSHSTIGSSSIYGGHRLSTQHEHGYQGLAGKSVAGSSFGPPSISEERRGSNAAQTIKRPEDVLKLVKERMFSWSYMMQWYEDNIHWFNAVKVSRSIVENTLGPSKIDQRARNFFVLGISLSALFDITSAVDFLRALLKLLDDWENWAEGSGSKGVKNLFRGPRGGKRPSGSGMSDFPGGIDNTESYLLTMNLPFQPDFFHVHSSTCSIIRDLYKKLLGMVLPSRSSVNGTWNSLIDRNTSLIHSSTIIQSAELESPFTNPLSPAGGSSNSHGMYQSFSASSIAGHGGTGESSAGGTSDSQGVDALQLFVAGELPSDRTLVGDGQKLTPQLVELIYKFDAKLKKHFSALVREGDMLARKVLDDEFGTIASSLTAGGPALRFDYSAALSLAGNGLYGGGSSGLDSSGIRDRDFGTI